MAQSVSVKDAGLRIERLWFESWLRQLLSSPDVLRVISTEVVSSVADIEDYFFSWSLLSSWFMQS